MRSKNQKFKGHPQQHGSRPAWVTWDQVVPIHIGKGLKIKADPENQPGWPWAFLFWWQRRAMRSSYLPLRYPRATCSLCRRSDTSSHSCGILQKGKQAHLGDRTSPGEIEPHTLKYKFLDPVLLLGVEQFADVDIWVHVKGHVAQIYAI